MSRQTLHFNTDMLLDEAAQDPPSHGPLTLIPRQLHTHFTNTITQSQSHTVYKGNMWSGCQWVA